MNESATSAIATMPIANANGAAGPVACTIKVMLKAAVTVGDTTERERPRASGSRKRETKLVMFFPRSAPLPLGRTMSPHLKRRHVRVRHETVFDIGQGLIHDRDSFIRLSLAQRQGRSELQDVAAKPDVKEESSQLVGS